jgi:hypothetical protein
MPLARHLHAFRRIPATSQPRHGRRLRTMPWMGRFVFRQVNRTGHSVIDKIRSKTFTNQRVKLLANETGQVLDLAKITILEISNLFDMNRHADLQECSQVTRILIAFRT